MVKKDILVSVKRSAADSRENSGVGGVAESADAAVIQMAVVADGSLLDYATSGTGGQSSVGSVYKGLVTNIFPGTQSCFVNIGQGKNAVLYARDLAPAVPESRAERPIETLLRTGQKLVVQVLRDASGDKGARVTTKLALPGKYMVLLPDSVQSAVSKKITDPREQLRLRDFARKNAPEGCGLIARTEGQGVAEALLIQDVAELARRLRELRRKEAENKVPDCIHIEYDFYRELIFRALEADVARVISDDSAAYRELLRRAADHEPDVSYKLHHYREPWPMFAFYGIQSEIQNLTARKIWLKCGAYIVIDLTEAMTVVDVNTGKYSGGSDPNETILRVNREAVVEAARQLRFRDIGGIVVIDVIRMSRPEDQRAVVAALEAELQNDRQKTVVAGLTRLGLLELTRKKAGAPNSAAFTDR
jgi:ribonuclease G